MKNASVMIIFILKFKPRISAMQKRLFTMQNKRLFTVLFPQSLLQSNSIDTVLSKKWGYTHTVFKCQFSFSHQTSGHKMLVSRSKDYPSLLFIYATIQKSKLQSKLISLENKQKTNYSSSAIRTVIHKCGILIPMPKSAFDIKQSSASISTISLSC